MNEPIPYDLSSASRYLLTKDGWKDLTGGETYGFMYVVSGDKTITYLENINDKYDNLMISREHVQQAIFDGILVRVGLSNE